ncbi:MAG: alkaline phosphatase family protein, partial [Chloroflexota bacterium]
DADGDGFAFEGGTCGVSDCDDSNPLVNPNAAEVCDNGIDDNCNGKIDAEDAACGAPPNIIVVGWDGAQRDHLMECYNQQLPECSAGLPNLAALGGGMVYDSTITSGDTATKPGWAQIFSGYNAEVLGIYSNGDYQPIPEGYTVFEKLENNFGDENIVTMFISGKSIHTGAACVGDSTYENGQPVTEDQGQPWCLTKDHLDYYENDLRQNLVVGNRALELLETHQNDLFFASFIFRVPDVIGHIGGENSSQYTQAIVGDDIWLGNIVDKLVELGIDDRTLIYVTTDHGFDEDGNTHGNAPYTFLVTNDPLVVREGDRKDIAPTILERYGISLGPLGNAPAVDGFSLYSFPAFECVPEGQAFIDYEGAPACCSGLSLISLDRAFNRNLFTYATGGTGDNSGYCTACGDGICTEPENFLNCSADCN